MLHTHHESFPLPPQGLYQAVLSYVRSKPQYYTDVVESRDTSEIDATMTVNFAYSAHVHFTITPDGQGSALAIHVKTSWIFFMDPIGFWPDYCRRVVSNVRAQLRAA